MELFNSIVTSFGLNPEITTFTDLIVWLVGIMTAFLIVSITLKTIFMATWKIERSLR